MPSPWRRATGRPVPSRWTSPMRRILRTSGLLIHRTRGSPRGVYGAQGRCTCGSEPSPMMRPRFRTASASNRGSPRRFRLPLRCAAPARRRTTAAGRARRIERRSDARSGVVGRRRPTARRPQRGGLRDDLWVGDAPSFACHHHVEASRGDTDRAACVACDVPRLAGSLAGLEPHRPRVPERADTRDVRAPVGVQGGQPERRAIRRARVVMRRADLRVAVPRRPSRAGIVLRPQRDSSHP